MSSRPFIRGFDLQKLKNLFGCENDKVERDLWELYFKRHGKDCYYSGDVEMNQEIKNLIHNIVMGNLSPKDAEREIDYTFKPLMTSVLSWYDQDLIWPEENIPYVFNKTIKNVTSVPVKNRVREDILKLLENVFTGRGLFTESFCNYDIIYSYLTHEELKKLLNYIDENERLFYHRGWERIAQNWLRNLANNKKDLFYIWS